MPIRWTTSTTASFSLSSTTTSSSYAFSYGRGTNVSRIINDYFETAIDPDPNGKREEYGLTFDDLVKGEPVDVRQ